MRLISLVGISTLAWVIYWSAPADAIPVTVSFQSVLRSSSSGPVSDGPHDVTFGLYTTESGATALWSEAHTGANGVQTKGGLFSTTLGSITPIPLAVLVNNDTLFVGVNVAGEDEHPRPQLSAVPFAFRAGRVDSIDGAAGGTIAGSTAQGAGIITINQTGTGDGIRIKRSPGTNQNFTASGILVENDASGNAVTGISNFGADPLFGIYGVRTGAGGAGVAGESQVATSAGIVGIGPGNLIEGRTATYGPRVFSVDNNGSITIEQGAAPLLYAEATAGSSSANSRYWIAHSHTYPNWGIYYNDATDTVEFHGNGVPVAGIGLSSGSSHFFSKPTNFNSGVNVSGGATVAGTATFNGSATFNNNLSVVGTLSSDQLPRSAQAGPFSTLSIGANDLSNHEIGRINVNLPAAGYVTVFGSCWLQKDTANSYAGLLLIGPDGVEHAEHDSYNFASGADASGESMETVWMFAAPKGINTFKLIGKRYDGAIGPGGTDRFYNATLNALFTASTF